MTNLNDVTLPDAGVLRQQRNNATYEAAQSQLDSLARQIARAHEGGFTAIKHGKLLPGVEDALKRKGYAVRYYDGDQRDRVAAHEVNTISW